MPPEGGIQSRDKGDYHWEPSKGDRLVSRSAKGIADQDSVGFGYFAFTA